MTTLNFKAKFGLQVADSNKPSGFDLLPTGTIMYWAGPATQSVDINGIATTTGIPSGWLLCDGNQVSRSVYANLDALLVTATPNYPYGNGDGSTTFHLPNCKGRVLSHEGFTPTNTNKQLTGVEGSTLADSNIVQHTHTLNTHSHSGLNSHTHGGTAHTHTTGSHSHSYPHVHPGTDVGSSSHTHSIYNVATAGPGTATARAGSPTAIALVAHGASPHTHGSTTNGATGTDENVSSFNTSTLTSADTASSTGASSNANTNGNGGGLGRDAISYLQPFVVLHTIIKI